MASTINIGGKELTLLPLNMKAVKQLAACGHIARLSEMNPSAPMSAEQVDAVIMTVTLSIQRSHPSITSEWVEENLEFDRIADALSGIFGQQRPNGPNVESPSTERP